jgi:hypothetical protein
VATDGFWIGNRIYWALKHLVTTLHRSLSHRLVFSVTVFTALFGNVFQQWTFLCFRAHDPAGWRPSHTNLLFFSLLSQDYPVMAAGRTESTASIIACSLVARGTMCPQSCSLATAVVLSPVYTALTWQCIYMPQYKMILK